MNTVKVSGLYLMTEAMVNGTRQEYLSRFPFSYHGDLIRDIVRVGRGDYRLTFVAWEMPPEVVPGTTVITREKDELKEGSK